MIDGQEPTREDAELALMAAADDPRAHNLSGHSCAIALLAVLDNNGWRLLPKATPQPPQEGPS